MNDPIPQNPASDENEIHETVSWIDSESQTWSVSFSPRCIVLHCDSVTYEFPADAWPRDVYLSQSNESYVVRFDRFDVSLSFLLRATQVQPLLAILDESLSSTIDSDAESTASVESSPLLWPKVSPLALWSLGCASLTFIPVLGLVAGLVSVWLLVLHRQRIRNARAWSHSRRLCKVAIVLLVMGIPISVQATRTLLRYSFGSPDQSISVPNIQRGQSHMGSVLTPRSQIKTGNALSQFSGSFLERDHNWGLILAGLLVVLFSLSVHEAAHAISAWWLGDDFAKRLGRVTLHPASHIDPFGTVILPLILFLANVGVFGFAKPVPVRTEVLERPRRGHILISLAGPGVNLLMAAVSIMLLLGFLQLIVFVDPHVKITHISDFNFSQFVVVTGISMATPVATICTILKLSFLINALLAFFNLIPIPPLDGSWVLEKLFPHSIGILIDRVRPYSMLVFLAALYTNAFSYLLFPAILVIAQGLLILEMCTPPGIL